MIFHITLNFQVFWNLVLDQIAKYKSDVAGHRIPGFAQAWKVLEFRGLSWKVLEN